MTDYVLVKRDAIRRLAEIVNPDLAPQFSGESYESRLAIGQRIDDVLFGYTNNPTTRDNLALLDERTFRLLRNCLLQECSLVMGPGDITSSDELRSIFESILAEREQQ